MSPKSKTVRPAKTSAHAAAAKPNHHLWRHGKNWWVYCAVNPTSCTKDKLRRSLNTESVRTARRRRDELFRQLQEEGMLGRMRTVAGSSDAQRKMAATGRGELTWQQRADAALAIAMALHPNIHTKNKLPDPVVGSGKGKMQLCCS